LLGEFVSEYFPFRRTCKAPSNVTRREFLGAAAIAAAWWAADRSYGQTTVRSGEFASVASGGTPLVVNNQPAAQLPEDTWFEAVRSTGSWTAGYAHLDGVKKSGWVLTAKLIPDSIERQSQVAAAWEARGAKVERDAREAVLAIDATDSEVSDAELERVIAFPRLEELSLAGSNATAAGLAPLAKLPRLARLFLDGLRLSDDGLAPLEKLKGLESLSLANTPISDMGLTHLSGLTNLQVLNLSDCSIADEGLAHIAPLVNMETLALKNTKVRGPGLVFFQNMERLNVLNLSNCPIEGENLELLNNMEHLRILHVAGCNIEPKYIEALENNSVSLAIFD
jgi:hypothetical protein